VSRFQFVADHSDAFEVKWLCAVMQIARSSFYAWLAGADGRAAREAADADLVGRIRAVHAGDNTYGAPRITAELSDGAPDAQRVNHKRVARVMRAARITATGVDDGSKPPWPIRPTRRFPTCSTVTSPPRCRT